MQEYLDPPEYPEPPECPICGSTIYDYIYKDINDEICGCSDCVYVLNACEWMDELEQENEPDPDREYEAMRDRQAEEKLEEEYGKDNTE